MAPLSLLAFVSSVLAVNAAPATGRRLSDDVTEQPIYQWALDTLWPKVDANSNDHIDFAEWQEAFRILGVASPDEVDATATFNFADRDSDTEISQQDIVYLIDNYVPDIKEVMVAKFTQIPMNSDGFTFSIDVSDTVKNSAGKSTFTITLAGDITDYFGGEREAVRQKIADLAGVELDAVVLLWLGGSVNLEAKIFYPTAEKQSEGEANLKTQLIDATPAAASAVLGHDVESVSAIESTVAAKESTVNYVMIAPFAAMLFVVAIGACVVGLLWARKKGGGKSCCGPCCAPNSIQAWVGSNILTVCIVLGAVFYLYFAVTPIVEAVTGIINALSGMGEKVPQVGEALPLGVIDQIKPYSPYLGVVVLVPGLLAAFLMLVASGCGCRTKALCCSKCFVGLADVVLIISLVFYCIFAAVAVLSSQPIVAEQLATVTGVCDTTLPELAQISADAKANFNKLELNGADMEQLGEAEQQLQSSDEAVGLLTEACDDIQTLISSLIGLWLPGIFCIFAVALAFINTQGLCCSEGCCTTPKAKPDAKNNPLVQA